MVERLRRLTPAVTTAAMVLVLVGLTVGLVGAPAAAGPDHPRGSRSAASGRALGAGSVAPDSSRAPCELVSDILFCGTAITGTTQGGTSSMSSYSCIQEWEETGPEVVYEFVAPAGGPWVVTAELAWASADLDLFVLGPVCESDACVAAGDNSVTFEIDPGQMYFIVVDGYRGASGAFFLELSCQDASLPPQVGIATALSGDPGAGGNLPYFVDVWNEGPGGAITVTVTGSLAGLHYLYDTSLVPVVTATISGGEQVVWQLGDLPAGSHVGWEVFTRVDAALGAGVVGGHVVEVGNAAGEDPSNNGSVISSTVTTLNSDVAVLAAPGWSGPVPAAKLPWPVLVCNQGSTSSPEVLVTTTLGLPGDIQAEDWWSDQPGWMDVSWTPNEVTVSRGSLANGDCAFLYLVSHIAPNLPLGTWLCLEASAVAGNDTDPDDNSTLVCTQVGTTLFGDGFETGSLSLWSQKVP